MTPAQDGTPRIGDGGRLQWMDRGVNVGHAMYGDIHIHPPEPQVGPSGFRPAPPFAPPALQTGALRSALQRLTLACDRTSSALESAGPDLLREEKR